MARGDPSTRPNAVASTGTTSEDWSTDPTAEMGGIVVRQASVVQLPGYRSPLEPSRALKAGTSLRPREFVSEVQRDRLIDAFVQVVVEQGFESAWIKTICRRAGVAFNTFYELYRSKEELLLTAYDAGVAVLFNVTSAAYFSDDVPWRRRVEVGLGTFLQTLADNPIFARFFAIEIHKAGPHGQARVDQSIEAASAMFTNVEAAPGLAIPATELVPLVVGSIYEQIYFYIRSGRISELPSLNPTLTTFAAHMFTNADFGVGPSALG
ncbi:MAG TPA: TetR/AcrR family transcriptional regulator [Acidimicrobiales bacterium]